MHFICLDSNFSYGGLLLSTLLCWSIVSETYLVYMYFSPFLQSSEFSSVSGISACISAEKHSFRIFFIVLGGVGTYWCFMGFLVSRWLVGIVHWACDNALWLIVSWFRLVGDLLGQFLYFLLLFAVQCFHMFGVHPSLCYLVLVYIWYSHSALQIGW